MALGLLHRTKSENLREDIDITEAAARIDRETGVIPSVKICGRQSKNGREYTTRALQDGQRLYEGAEVNLNHPMRGREATTRDIREGWGVIRNVQLKNDGCYGDLNYLTNHPDTPWLLERIDRGMPIGLSHNANGKVSGKHGKVIVESLREVRSVDVVTKPATNVTLFESEEDMLTVKEIFEEHKKDYESLADLIEEIGAEAAMAEAPVDGASEMSADEQMKAAFRAAIIAAFDDSSLDTSATLKKIKEILKSYDKLSGTGDEGSEPPVDEGGDEETPEAITKALDKHLTPLTETIQSMKRREEIRDVMEEFGVTRKTIGDDKYKLLEGQKDADGMRKLIESWPGVYRGLQRPTAHLKEGDSKNKKVPRLAQMRRA